MYLSLGLRENVVQVKVSLERFLRGILYVALSEDSLDILEEL
jgi:hypothetical protein